MAYDAWTEGYLKANRVKQINLIRISLFDLKELEIG